MTVTIFFFILGLIVLVLGAESLVRGASRLASILGISPLVIGLTVVALGTSSPEIAVSVQSALAGQADIAIGNVIGSNIFNILLILGVSALIRPIKIAEQLIRLDAPIMLGASLLVMLFAWDGSFSRVDGAILFSLLIAYVIFSFKKSKSEKKEIQDEYAEAYQVKEPASWKSIGTNTLLAVAGLVMLGQGANWLVESAVVIAQALGVSELVIGLTVITIGTSLPEVAASVVAAIKGEGDIAAGNVIGSNIFNLFGVLGAASLAAPTNILISQQVLNFDLPVALFVAFVTLPVFFVENRVSRLDGFLFLSYFAAYNTYVILRAMNHSALGILQSALTIYVPTTFILLFFFAARHYTRQRNAV